MQTIMMVTAANQLYTLAGVAQLVESILIEQVTFNHRVERSNRFTSTNEGQKAYTFYSVTPYYLTFEHKRSI